MGSKSGTPTSAGVMVVSPTSLTARPPGQPGIGRCRRDQPAGDPASLAADHYACGAPAVTAVIVAFGGIRVPTVTVYAIELSLEVPGLAGLADRSTSQSLLALACRPPPRGTRSRRSAARHRRAAGWRRWLAVTRPSWPGRASCQGITVRFGGQTSTSAAVRPWRDWSLRHDAVGYRRAGRPPGGDVAEVTGHQPGDARVFGCPTVTLVALLTDSTAGASRSRSVALASCHSEVSFGLQPPAPGRTPGRPARSRIC